LEIAQKFNAKLEEAQAILGLANTYKKQGKYIKAIQYFEQGKTIAEEIESYQDLKDAYEGLALSYSEVSDFKNAFEY